MEDWMTAYRSGDGSLLLKSCTVIERIDEGSDGAYIIYKESFKYHHTFCEKRFIYLLKFPNWHVIKISGDLDSIGLSGIH